MNCLLKITVACCYDAQGGACFGQPHRRTFGSVEVGARLDDLIGECLGQAVLGEMPVAVHHVEVELRRVDDEMVVVQVIGVGHGFQKPAPLVERDFRVPAVPDACSCFRFLRRELDGQAVMRSGFGASTCRADDAMVIAGRQGHPRPDLVRPCPDLGVICLGPERQRGLAGGLGRLPVT